ncbi:MAG: hypothetical protein OEV95_07045 [Gemmatimonadota bacterium]|nr:hypothetical protein [Gemmatimonadota bacterium]
MLPTRALALAMVLGLSGSSATPAGAIPAFARRYKVSCQLCHNPIPKLTDFGYQFAANGYRMAAAEEPHDSIATGDELLTLLKEVPLAIRLDMYAQLYADGNAAVDFQTPYGLKLLSGGPVTKKISYYFYTFLVERGDIGGVEDAFIHVNDIAGAPVDLMAGQFQVSDPLFKRELRLEFEDYAVYRARVGLVPANLTYERGIMATADLAGFTLTGQVLNGNGVEPAQPNRHFDVDASKNVFGHITRDIVSALRLGVFGYYGRSHGNDLTDETRMVGVDGTLSLGIVEVNGQYIHRRDDQPTYTPGEPEVTLNGGFGEVIVRPAGSRFFGYGLYNLVSADQPLVDVGEGGPPNVSRYETVAGGVGYLASRNVKLNTEVQYDLEQESARFTLGLVLAY